MNTDLFDKENKYFVHTYNRIPVDIAYGQGVHLFDKKGNRYHHEIQDEIVKILTNWK